MRRLRPVVACTQLMIAVSAAPTPAVAQSLAGEKIAAIFVTMTRGAACPSSSTVAFKSQGKAAGAFEGLYDDQGSFRLLSDEAAGTMTVAAFTSTFKINRTVGGEMVWEASDTTALPLRISCDSLALHIEGDVRYRGTYPLVEAGTAHIQIWGAREAITEPYFGRSVITFSAPR